MSFSTALFVQERPYKVPRLSISFNEHDLPSTFFVHQNVSYLFAAEAGSLCSAADRGRLLHHHHHHHHHHHYYHPLLYSPICYKEINLIKNCYEGRSATSDRNRINSAASLLSSTARACSVLCSAHSSLQTHVWRTLPDELIERILAFLPISSVFRFTLVCKSWRDLFHSRPFVCLRAQLPYLRGTYPQNRTFFLAVNRSRYQQLSAYEALSNKWYSFPLDFLPTVAYPVASAAGLICFLSTNLDTGNATILVCNPVTRKWKELPALLFKRVPLAVSIVVDRKSMSYKILVAGGLEDSDSNTRKTEMYDSTTGRWVLCGQLPKNEDIARSIVEYCGYYVCLTRGPGSGLLAFNLQTQLWMKMKTGKIPGYSKFRHLVECGGTILVIGKAWRRYVLGLYIWRLDPKTLRWKEVGKMPRSICEQFFSSPSECFYCTAQGHLIFFSRYFYNQGLVYNTLENSWQHVSGCPLLTHPLLLPFDPGLDPVD